MGSPDDTGNRDRCLGIPEKGNPAEKIIKNRENAAESRRGCIQGITLYTVSFCCINAMISIVVFSSRI